MREARLHWFWRMAISLIGIYIPLLMIAVPDNFTVVFLMLGLAVPVICYALLTRYFGPVSHDDETRCRKCSYILRGISEPRCPECGERI